MTLGAVSPDLPYLGLGTVWADKMHLDKTGGVVREAARLIREVDDVNTKAKLLAWLLGYVSHVAGDITIHPIVNLKVGPYAENKTAHRECEMSQDSYIFKRLNIGNLGVGEFIGVNIGKCVASDGKIDANIELLWKTALKKNIP